MRNSSCRVKHLCFTTFHTNHHSNDHGLPMPHPCSQAHQSFGTRDPRSGKRNLYNLCSEPSIRSVSHVMMSSAAPSIKCEMGGDGEKGYPVGSLVSSALIYKIVGTKRIPWMPQRVISHMGVISVFHLWTLVCSQFFNEN